MVLFVGQSWLTHIYEQTLRWRPVAAGGVPHALTEDDYYEGYFLPKGTILFANTWAINRTDEFKDAESFVPERYLENRFGIVNTDAESNDSSKRRVQYGFGAGRRVCSGQRLAENSLVSIAPSLSGCCGLAESLTQRSSTWPSSSGPST